MDEKLIEAARERARAAQTTLNEQFHRWLADYVRQEQPTESAAALIGELRDKCIRVAAHSHETQ